MAQIQIEIAEPVRHLRVADVVSALSQALDLGSGSTHWHSVRTCVLGMRIADRAGLSEQVRNDLYYALLLKDAGCSSNASEIYHALGSDEISAKGDVKRIDWTRTSRETLRYALDHVAPGKPFWQRLKAIAALAAQQKEHTRKVTAVRCERGASMARLMGLGEGVANGIAGLDEHWDGSGNPQGACKEAIPLTSRVMLLAQTLDAILTECGAETAWKVAKERSGRWFDPELVKITRALHADGSLWHGLNQGVDQELALEAEPQQRTLETGDRTFDNICQAFAQIVDAKSPFTFNHSNGVANAAITIAQRLNLPPERILFVRHAALLHDLGKMAVSNSILEKPGKLDDAEWVAMRSHPEYTRRILLSIRGFEELSEVAASHHEKLNGKGYYRGLTADQMSVEARILVVADIFDALTANRPYREGMPLHKVYAILRSDIPHALDADCVEALEQSGIGCDQTYRNLDSIQNDLIHLGASIEAADKSKHEWKTQEISYEPLSSR